MCTLLPMRVSSTSLTESPEAVTGATRFRSQIHVEEVLSNIRSAFVETATKMWAYSRCLANKQPQAKVVIGGNLLNIHSFLQR